MPDPSQNPQETKLPPPNADPQQAAKYIDWVVELINKDKITVKHSDLSKFSVDALQDHYHIDLNQYDVEVSHSKHPKTGDDIYTMIFNNLSHINENNQRQRVILAYIHLSKSQFERFKNTSESQIQRKWRQAEEKRFRDAMSPIDDILDQISSKQSETDERQDAEKSSNQDKGEVTLSSLAANSSAPLPEPMKLPPVPDSPANPQTDNQSWSETADSSPQANP